MQHLSKTPECQSLHNELSAQHNNQQRAKRARVADVNVIVPEFLDPDLERERQNPFYPYIYDADDDFHLNDDALGNDGDRDEANIASINLEDADGSTTHTRNDGNQINYTLEQKFMVSLMKLLDGFAAPDYAVERIIEWASEAHQCGWDFVPKNKTRKGNVKWMYSMIKNAQHFLPKVRVVEHPYGPPIECITYDFVPQLLSLL